MTDSVWDDNEKARCSVRVRRLDISWFFQKTALLGKSGHRWDVAFGKGRHPARSPVVSDPPPDRVPRPRPVIASVEGRSTEGLHISLMNPPHTVPKPLPANASVEKRSNEDQMTKLVNLQSRAQALLPQPVLIERMQIVNRMWLLNTNPFPINNVMPLR